MTNLLLIEKFTVSGATLKEKSYEACYMLFNGRWVGIKKPAPSIRHTAIQPRKKDEKPGVALKVEGPSQETRTSFFYTRLLSMILTGSTLYLYNTFFHAPNYYAHQQTQYLTQRPNNLSIRALTVIPHSITNYCTYTLIHTILSITAVCNIQLNHPKDWPPLYGTITSAYTMRNFWSRFWHQIVYRTYTNLASVALYPILPSPYASPSSNYTDNTVSKKQQQKLLPYRHILESFLVFFYSGALHGLVSWQVGYRCGIWSEVLWFVANFGALIVERLG